MNNPGRGDKGISEGLNHLGKARNCNSSVYNCLQAETAPLPLGLRRECRRVLLCGTNGLVIERVQDL